MNVITDNLSLWASAEVPRSTGGRGRSSNSSKSPYGIQKLRELILDLAIRGKLTPQLSNEEPADVLKFLERSDREDI